MQTWNGDDLVYKLIGLKNFLSVFLSFKQPQYGNTFKLGQNLLTSCCQLYNVALGVITRKGPQLSKYIIFITYFSFQINVLKEK